MRLFKKQLDPEALRKGAGHLRAIKAEGPISNASLRIELRALLIMDGYDRHEVERVLDWLLAP